jgi:hypothetical protein
LTIAVAVQSFNTDNAKAIKFNGTAVLANNAIHLTSATNDQAGSAFWKSRVSLTNNRSFSSYFVLSFNAPGGKLPTGADGIVFTMQTQSDTAGSPGSGMGFSGIKPSIGIEFDTWQNNEVNDPNDNHVGLDVGGSVVSVATNAVPLPGDLQGNTWHIWVDYNGSTQKLQVHMHPTNDRAASTLVLDVSRNLADDIGPDVYVGFTAGTGDAFESHDVQTFYFINDFVPLDTNATPPNTYLQMPNQISAVASPAAINPGETTTVTITVFDIFDNPVPNQMVAFTTSRGTLLNTSGVTDANGKVSVTLNGVTASGSTTVRGSIAGGLYAEASVFVRQYIYLPLVVKR